MRSYLVKASIMAVLMAGLTIGSSSGTPGNQAQKRNWRFYKNARWDFCIRYPATWKSIVPTDGSGIELYPQGSFKAERADYIEVGALPNQRQNIGNPSAIADNSSPLELGQIFARSLDGLREYQGASDIRVVKKLSVRYQGYSAQETVIRYHSRPRGTRWIQRTLWVNRDEVIFAVTLRARSTTYRELLPYFMQLVRHGLRITCPGSR